jgi:ribosomal protein S18 acetylase RimI-like enzyme
MLSDAMPDDAVLDNPAWYALAGSQQDLGLSRPRAARYRAEVAPFAGLTDASDPLAWNDLADLVAATGPVAIGDTGPGLPDGWSVLASFPALQMVLSDPSAATSEPPAGLRALTEPDVPAMLDLVARTDPGPFGRDTIAFGGYLGVWRGPRLVAMAGRRMNPQGWVEVSAVCTDPDFQGQGLARRVIGQVVAGIDRDGQRPFLHVMQSNVGAIGLYESMGFSVRRDVGILVVHPA